MLKAEAVVVAAVAWQSGLLIAAAPSPPWLTCWRAPPPAWPSPSPYLAWLAGWLRRVLDGAVASADVAAEAAVADAVATDEAVVAGESAALLLGWRRTVQPTTAAAALTCASEPESRLG